MLHEARFGATWSMILNVMFSMCSYTVNFVEVQCVWNVMTYIVKYDQEQCDVCKVKFNKVHCEAKQVQYKYEVQCEVVIMHNMKCSGILCLGRWSTMWSVMKCKINPYSIALHCTSHYTSAHLLLHLFPHHTAQSIFHSTTLHITYYNILHCTSSYTTLHIIALLITLHCTICCTSFITSF